MIFLAHAAALAEVEDLDTIYIGSNLQDAVRPGGHGFPDSGADFLCVGMFDFQVATDAQLTQRAVEKAKRRKRPWASATGDVRWRIAGSTTPFPAIPSFDTLIAPVRLGIAIGQLTIACGSGAEGRQDASNPVHARNRTAPVRS